MGRAYRFNVMRIPGTYGNGKSTYSLGVRHHHCFLTCQRSEQKTTGMLQLCICSRRETVCACSSGDSMHPSESTSTPYGWTPFSHSPEYERNHGDPFYSSGQSSQRQPRMVQTQKGEIDHHSLAGVSPDTQPDDACHHCEGTGLTTCQYCRGTSRINYLDAVTVPKGAWPMWCTRCIRCSGKTVCGFCLGTGKKREPIGFRVS